MSVTDLISLPSSLQIPLGVSDLTVKLNLIKRGSFLMGARGFRSTEEPVHKVYIPFDFYLAVYPVTQRQYMHWAQICGDRPGWFHSKGDDHPAYSISRHSGNAFCQWLDGYWKTCVSGTDKQHLAESLQVNIPTEAQWEYACSTWIQIAGSGSDDRVYTEYHTGDGPDALALSGWHGLNSGGKTHNVGEKVPNRIGLYDMHGNVAELCRDDWMANLYCYRPSLSDNPISINRQILTAGPPGILRGGSCMSSATDCRAASRRLLGFHTRPGFHGIRVGLFPRATP